MFDLNAIQSVMRDLGYEAWLLYDFRGSNPLARRVLGLAEVTRLRGHDAYVYALAFSPDGSMLVSGSGDHTVRVWDTRPVRERWMRRGVQGGAE